MDQLFQHLEEPEYAYATRNLYSKVLKTHLPAVRMLLSAGKNRSAIAMKKFFRRALLYIFLLLLLAVGLLAAGAAIFQKQIGRQVVEALNQQLATEIQVEEASLDLFRALPSVVANFRKVRIPDTRQDTLLSADLLSFRFGILSLINKDYQFRSVRLSEGELKLQRNQLGETNYAVLPTSDATTGGEEPSRIALEQIQVENILLSYQDKQYQQEMSLLVKKAELTGPFNRQLFKLQLTTDLHSNFVNLSKNRFLEQRDLQWQSNMQIDLSQGLYKISESTLTLGEQPFSIKGSIESQGKSGIAYDLTMNSASEDLQGILQLLPAAYADYADDLTVTGDLQFETRIKGKQSRESNPAIESDLRLQNGTIRSPRAQEPMTNVSLQVRYSNGNFRSRKSSILEINDFKGYFGRELSSMQLRINDFNDPEINLQATAKLPLQSIYTLFGNPAISEASGTLRIEDLVLRGNYADLKQASTIDDIEARGRLLFDDAAFVINNEKILFDRGELLLSGNQLLVQDVKLEGAGSEIELQGEASNLLPVLFEDAKDEQKEQLNFQAELYADHLEIDRLLTIGRLQLTQQDTAGARIPVSDSIRSVIVKRRARLTRSLSGTFKTTVTEFSYGRINGTDFTGLITLQDEQLLIKGGSNAMEGVVDVDGTLLLRDEPMLQASINLADISAPVFLEENRNFNQELLTAKKISGRADAQLRINASWDEVGQFKANDLLVQAKVQLREGALQDFALLKRFATFVKVPELRKLDFDRIDNYLEVRSKTLFIPAMYVQGKQMNMSLVAEHDFDGSFEYNCKLHGADQLVRSIADHDPSLQPLPAVRTDFFNVFYQVSGTADEIKVRSTRKQVQTNLQRKLAMRDSVAARLQRTFPDLGILREPANWQTDPNADSTDAFDFAPQRPLIDSIATDTSTAPDQGE